MRKVGFIGAYDKANLIMCVAKILSMKNKRVLIIDTTAEQKFKYIVPTLEPTMTYITTWEDIDIAVGFKKIEQVHNYIGTSEEGWEYDFILMNIDDPITMSDMRVEENDINCFVTAMDLYSIKKGIEIFKNIERPMRLVKIIFSREMTEEDNQYIDYLAMEAQMQWEQTQIFFPLILDDKYTEMDNQLIYRLGLRTMSSLYKDSLAILTAVSSGNEIKEQEAKRMIRVLEREGM